MLGAGCYFIFICEGCAVNAEQPDVGRCLAQQTFEAPQSVEMRPPDSPYNAGRGRSRGSPKHTLSNKFSIEVVLKFASSRS